ncbi:regulatory GntR family protein [Anaerobacterium chartisolvens]|uniref:Regulatory GntR family protein n=1 Tax=Anaerobacterium chartisolvens TaxID=1297424 RepID=A0A369AMI6_9FIRM|nr:GntR family transcriptional regulator [Anaerobacterium chartisolvens]RCX08664.1 regulatory GntR family protein [Anaerobacterium chartisolvens]
MLTIGAPVRFQSAYISDQEVERVVEWWKEKGTEGRGEMLDWDNVQAETDVSQQESGIQAAEQNSSDTEFLIVKKYIIEIASGEEEELYLPNIRQLEELLKINRRYILESLQMLTSEGWLEKVGDSSRTVKYKVLLSQDEALLKSSKYTE